MNVARILSGDESAFEELRSCLLFIYRVSLSVFISVFMAACDLYSSRVLFIAFLLCQLVQHPYSSLLAVPSCLQGRG